MAEDRYDQNRVLFVLGMMCLIMSLSFITFALYILPAMAWDWMYGVPEFLFYWREQFTDSYQFTQFGSAMLVFALFFIPGMLAALASVLISNKIDKKALGLAVDEGEESTEVSSRVAQEVKESFGFGAKLVLLSIAVVAGVWFVNWLLSTTPPETLQ